MDGPSELPSVTPSLLGRLDETCTLRLKAHHLGEGLSQRHFHRWNVRTPFLAACRQMHATMRRPEPAELTPPADLEPEEQAVFSAAAGGYIELFGDRDVRSIDHGCGPRPTSSPRRGVAIRGAVDLLVEDADGVLELRQLELWRRPMEPDPLDAVEIRLAVLRLLRPLGEMGANAVHVTHADLLARVATTRVVDLAAEREQLIAWFDDQVERLRALIADPRPSPGSICGTCGWLHRCPAMRARVRAP